MKNILKAISEVKKELGVLVKNTSNPFYKSKYFDINQLLEHTEPILEKHGLIVLQPIKENKVYSEIYHIESGEKMDSFLELPNLQDPQKIGSAVTYYRRYTLGSLLGIQAEDDDANKASGNTSKDDKNNQSNQAEQTPKVTNWLSEEKFNEALSDIEKAKKALDYYDGRTKRKEGIYGMKKEYREKLSQLLQTT